jgi:two-component system KDP operon response regulator KdpE
LENESDIVKAIELGADEYFIKPVGQMEIVVRVKALIRRLQSNPVHSRELTMGPWCYSPEKSKLYNEYYQISLTVTENSILQILSSEIGKVVTYGALAEAIWGTNYPDSTNAVRMHISRLRKKIEKDPGYSPLIIAKVGVGYYIEKP